MVKIATMNFPPGYEALVAKILAWFDNQAYPTWATRNRHNTRAAKAANAAKTYMPSIKDAWAALSPAEKTLWADAAVFGTLNRYQLFTSDYSYRFKNGLSVPGTPNNYHEMFGLQIDNPGGGEDVQLRRDEKDLIGPITIEFNYKKTQYSPTASVPFKMVATAYNFLDGENQQIVGEWSAPAGNVDWTHASLTLGVANWKYFHLTIIWYLTDYDASVSIDQLLIQGNSVDKYREDWQYKSGKTWAYTALYRKTGWLFTPQYFEPWFRVVYLG